MCAFVPQLAVHAHRSRNGVMVQGVLHPQVLHSHVPQLEVCAGLVVVQGVCCYSILASSSSAKEIQIQRQPVLVLASGSRVTDRVEFRVDKMADKIIICIQIGVVINNRIIDKTLAGRLVR